MHYSGPKTMPCLHISTLLEWKTQQKGLVLLQLYLEWKNITKWHKWVTLHVWEVFIMPYYAGPCNERLLTHGVLSQLKWKEQSSVVLGSHVCPTITHEMVQLSLTHTGDKMPQEMMCQKNIAWKQWQLWLYCRYIVKEWHLVPAVRSDVVTDKLYHHFASSTNNLIKIKIQMIRSFINIFQINFTF